MFTKQHHIVIAEIIDKKRTENCVGWTPLEESCIIEETLDEITIDLANFFSKDSPNFDEDKFLKACGY